MKSLLFTLALAGAATPLLAQPSTLHGSQQIPPIAKTVSLAGPRFGFTFLSEGIVEKLKGAGISTVEALADMTPEQLEAIEGIGPKTVEKISVAVNNYFASLEGGETVALPENEGEEAAAEASNAEELSASTEGEQPPEETEASESEEAAEKE